MKKGIPVFLFIHLSAAAAVIMIFLLSLNVTFRADDFVLQKLAEEMGIWGVMKHMYLNWDGRFISLNALIQLALLLYLGAPAGAWVWSLMLLATAFFMKEFFRHRYLLEVNGFVIVALLFCLQWLGYQNHLAETMYWVTGGIYMMNLGLMTGFLWIYLRKPEPVNYMWLTLGAVWGVMAGLSGVISGFPLLVFIVAEWLVKRSGSKRVYFMTWSLALITGLAVNVAAPGNYIRASALPTSWDMDPMVMLLNMLKISWRYLVLSLPAIAAGVGAAVLIPVKRESNEDRIARLWLRFRWLVVAFSGILPMLFIPDFAGGRTSIFFMAFLFLWIWEIAGDALTALTCHPGYRKFHKFMLMVFFILVMFIACCVFLFNQ
jgi:hypothetical protein